jgi:hypothetical protein
MLVTFFPELYRLEGSSCCLLAGTTGLIPVILWFVAVVAVSKSGYVYWYCVTSYQEVCRAVISDGFTANDNQ